MMRRAAAATPLLLAILGCQPAPSTAPTGDVATPGPAATTSSASPGATALSGTTLGDQLRDAISADDILADLGRLDTIAAANGGNRAAGSSGHVRSVELVEAALRAAGYEVSRSLTDLTAFSQDAPSVLEIQGPAVPRLADVHDFKAMLMSPSGDVTAELFPLGFDPAAQPGDRSGLGCDPADWAAVPAGVIVLVQPGGCRRRDVLINAQAAGAVGLVTSYADWTPDHVRRPTLIDPEGLSIPAVGVTGAAGLVLLAAAQASLKVHLVIRTTVKETQSPSLIAELPGLDPTHIVLIGGHLDSVIDGPGINDNGSGTMAILEIARELATLRPDGAPWTVRVAFWTGEEIGLLGSLAYAGGLTPEEAATIEAYLNFDMLGSPNPVRQVYEVTDTSRADANAVIAGLFHAALEAQNLTWEPISLGCQSDHCPFNEAGVPAGGLFSGADEIMTDAQATLFGGTAGAAQDPCYHLACDTLANVDAEVLGQLARAAAWVVGRLASGEVPLAP
jgi:Zn-dependent M28 family amino/carboxypeptidase